MLHYYIEFLRLLHNPSNVLVYIACIYHKEKFIVGHLVNEKVIDNTACRVQHHSIENFTIGSTCNIICKDIVYKRLALGACNQHLTHMRNIKNTTRLANSIMLLDNIAILDRHIKTSERAYERTKRHVLVIKTGSFILHNLRKFYLIILLIVL